MKRIVKNFFNAAVLSSTIFSCTNENIEIFNTSHTIIAHTEDSLSEGYWMQVKAYDNYNRLMNVMRQQTRSNNQSNTYPDYYGGAYINEENQLVVLITKGHLTTRDAVSIQNEVTDNVIYEPCEYSYNKIRNVIDSIKNELALTPELLSHVSMLGIDDAGNRVFMCLSDDLKSSTFDNDLITCFPGTFVHQENSPRIVNPDDATIPMPPTYPSILCGDSIYKRTATGWHGGSVGYRAIDEFGEVGFVTAGHNIELGKHAVCPSTKEVIAIAVNSKYLTDYIDAAFCTVSNKKFSLTNNINYTIKSNPQIEHWDTLSTHIVSNMIMGTTVYMSGMRSKNQVGRVISSYATFPIKVDTTDNNSYNDSILFRDVVLSDYSSQEGDSGGIVYTKRRVNNVDGTNCTVGIHVAYEDSIILNNKKIRPVVCIKAEHINSIMGLSRY